jgi:hypothetical protein
MMTEKELLNKIDEWHSSNSEVPLHDFLGWTFLEYYAYVKTGVIPETKQ